MFRPSAVPSAVPSADIFEAGESLFGSVESLLLAGITMAIVVVLFKEVFKRPTVMSMISGIVVAIFVGWLVTQYQNDDINEVFDETVTDTVGAPASPAGSDWGIS